MPLPVWVPWLLVAVLLAVASGLGWALFLVYHMLLTEREQHVFRRQDWEADRAHLQDVIGAQAEAFGRRREGRGNGTDG